MDNCYLGRFWDCETKEFKKWLETIDRNMTATKVLQHKRKDGQVGTKLEDRLLKMGQ